MKKTLSVLAVLGVVSFGIQSAEAFSWSNLNPANWGNSACPKCQKVKKCPKKCDPCATGAAAPYQHIQPCDPCKKSVDPCPCQKPVQKTCDPCNKLQQMAR